MHERLGRRRRCGQGADLNALEPEQLERLLADAMLADFKQRLGRIGIEYQTPVRP